VLIRVKLEGKKP